MDVYADLLEEAAAGRFDAPEAGWSAEQILAHLVRNQEALISLTERVLAGDLDPAPDDASGAGGMLGYDNDAATDPAELNRYVTAYGGRNGLADRLAETVTVLRDLSSRLGERGDTPVAVRLRDNGQVVLDRPMPLRDLIELDAAQHAAGHLAQLRALRRATPAG